MAPQVGQLLNKKAAAERDDQGNTSLRTALPLSFDLYLLLNNYLLKSSIIFLKLTNAAYNYFIINSRLIYNVCVL